jgi:hypothetical protein
VSVAVDMRMNWDVFADKNDFRTVERILHTEFELKLKIRIEGG